MNFRYVQQHLLHFLRQVLLRSLLIFRTQQSIVVLKKKTIKEIYALKIFEKAGCSVLSTAMHQSEVHIIVIRMLICTFSQCRLLWYLIWHLPYS